MKNYMFSIGVVGIRVHSDEKSYELFCTYETLKNNDDKVNIGEGTQGRVGGSFHLDGLNNFNILDKLLKKNRVEENIQFVVLYNASCPNREESINKTLAFINTINTRLKPVLVSVGSDNALPVEIIEQFSKKIALTKESDSKNLLEQEVTYHFTEMEKEFTNFAQSAPSPVNALPVHTNAGNTSMNMMILGGFIAALGLAAVALAFTALNAATLGVAGLIVACIGGAGVLGGLGLFAFSAHKNRQANEGLSAELTVCCVK